jgi:hypothetical protein
MRARAKQSIWPRGGAMGQLNLEPAPRAHEAWKKTLESFQIFPHHTPESALNQAS